MSIQRRRFQEMFYQKFVCPGGLDVRKVAKMLGVNLSTFYNWVEGVSYFPPDLIGNLYNATKDPDFLTFVVAETDMMVVPRKDAKQEKSSMAEHLDIDVHMGRMSEIFRDAQKDGHIDDFERARIIKAAEGLHREIEEFTQAVKKGA